VNRGLDDLRISRGEVEIRELCTDLDFSLLLIFAKVMDYYPFYYIPLTLPSPPTAGERIKVRGPNVTVIFVPLFT
jgi:hypothetical protein